MGPPTDATSGLRWALRIQSAIAQNVVSDQFPATPAGQWWEECQATLTHQSTHGFR